ncbi:Protein of unknown function, partial [Gryllus bimaculatus]
MTRVDGHREVRPAALLTPPMALLVCEATGHRAPWNWAVGCWPWGPVVLLTRGAPGPRATLSVVQLACRVAGHRTTPPEALLARRPTPERAVTVRLSATGEASAMFTFRKELSFNKQRIIALFRQTRTTDWICNLFIFLLHYMLGYHVKVMHSASCAVTIYQISTSPSPSKPLALATTHTASC